MSRRGIPFVISGPSGAGKSTLLRLVLLDDPKVCFSVSHTTRAPRPGEVNGRDYWFVDRESFQQMVDAGAFLEWAEYQDNLYGTSRKAVEGPIADGQDIILEVEVEGASQLRQRLSGAVFVFIGHPSLEVVEDRLRRRGTDPEDVIRKRIARAAEEMKRADEYDHVVINEELERALADLQAVIGQARATVG